MPPLLGSSMPKPGDWFGAGVVALAGAAALLAAPTIGAAGPRVRWRPRTRAPS